MRMQMIGLGVALRPCHIHDARHSLVCYTGVCHHATCTLMKVAHQYQGSQVGEICGCHTKGGCQDAS